MTFNDLFNLNEQVIEYYYVDGHSIKPRKAKVHVSNFNIIYLKVIDKLGRYKGTYHYMNFNGTYSNPNPRNLSYYTLDYGKLLFLEKDDAYNYVINRLRKQRQEINKKMLNIQMELYGKNLDR